MRRSTPSFGHSTRRCSGLCGRRLPERLARTLLDLAGVDPETTGDTLTKGQRRDLAGVVTELRLPLTGDRGYRYAEVTAGGVPLAELDLNSMESRVTPGLHLCGEICDVDGRIGGFNFQWAWGKRLGRGAGDARMRGRLVTNCQTINLKSEGGRHPSGFFSTPTKAEMTTLKRFLLITAFATFPLTFLSCDYWWGNGDGDLPDGGLIAHYPLDGDADENVGGRDGIIVGATPVADRFGEAGRALRFDGDDFVRVDESGVFNFDLQEDSYTISLWANASNSDGLSRLVVKWDELTSSPYPFQINKVGSGAWGSVFDSQEVSTVRLGDVLGTAPGNTLSSPTTLVRIG